MIFFILNYSIYYCGAWAQDDYEVLGQTPILLVFDGYGVSYNGKDLLEPIQQPRGRCLLPNLCSFQQCVGFSRKPSSIELKHFLSFLLFLAFSHVSLSNCQPPNLLLSAFIYRLLLVGRHDERAVFHVDRSLWDKFLTRWDPLLVTFLKLATIAKWCSVGDLVTKYWPLTL